MDVKFSLLDYDCVGFDMDNTLARYRIEPMYRLIYDALARFLVEERGYGRELLQPIDPTQIHKGLVFDQKRGNVLKLGAEGVVLRAQHGSRQLSQSEITSAYGVHRKWEAMQSFRFDMFENGLYNSSSIPSFKDNFDMQVPGLIAHIVDNIEAKKPTQQASNTKQQEQDFNFFQDILDALNHIYKYGDQWDEKGLFFQTVESDFDSYMYQLSDKLKALIQSLKQDHKKIVFLLTGSSIGYVSLCSKFLLGPEWRNYFDIVLTRAKKPGFFTGSRQFLRPEATIGDNDLILERDSIYAQGNSKELYQFFQTLTHKSDPKIVYFGDNLVQDVIVPAKYAMFDTVAILDEMEVEGMLGLDNFSSSPSSSQWLQSSPIWGSLFYDDSFQCSGDSTASGVQRINTFWGDCIQRYSQLAIPNLEELVGLMDNGGKAVPAFNELSANKNVSGFYPADPKSLHL